MEIIGVVVIITVVFWGTIRNLRSAAEEATEGLEVQAMKFTATTAKTLTAEDIETLDMIQKLKKNRR